MVGVDLCSIYYNSHRCFYLIYLSLKHIFFIYGFLSALLQSPQSGLKCRTKFTEIKFSVMHHTYHKKEVDKTVHQSTKQLSIQMTKQIKGG